MKTIPNEMMKRFRVRSAWVAAFIITLAMQPFTAGPAVAVTTVPVLWTAGGLSAGVDSAGQSARITSDSAGNVAVVSGPAYARYLAVTSYTASGTLRWRRTIEPALGTFVGDWVVAAPNGDFIAIGHNQDSHGRPIQSTMVRYDTDGTQLWRVDFSSGFYPAVGRLVVDSAGNAYLTWNSVGNGLFVQKYSPSGALLWSQGSSNGGIYAIATSLALSPDETDVVATGDVQGGATWITAVFDTTTGVPRWEVAAPEGIANLDVVVDAARVYVTGQGNVGTSWFLTVVAYDRATGTRLWRRDANPPTGLAYGTRIALAPDGSLAVAGRTSSGGYFDWWIVSLGTDGSVRWQARRDEALSGDEVPAAVFVLADGTTVVSGTGGPVIHDQIGNSYMQGVTAGYSSNGTLLWEAFSRLPTAWGTALPNGDVCATGGYDALTTCWRVPSTQTPTPTPPALLITSGTISYCSNPTLNPVPNVTLNLTGAMSGSTLSDGSGNYAFSSLPVGGNYTVTPTKTAMAPASAGINTVDVVAGQRHFLLIGTPLSGCRLTAADVNGDTVVNTVDVIAIQRFFLGLTIGIANTGKYNFAPANRSYLALSSNLTGQNFDAMIYGDVATGFVHRGEGPSQTGAVNEGMSAGEVAPTVAAVALPEVAVDQSKSTFIAAVKTTAIDATSHLVGFQGDFTFDERVITFRSEPVQNAGLTGGNWKVSGNVLPGKGPMRTLRVSAFSLDFTPLSGEGTLFELRITKVGKAAQSTQLIWAAPPDDFIFIDADLNTQRPGNAAPGSAIQMGTRK
jgi:hypothetical protein